MKHLIFALAITLCYSCSKGAPDEPIVPSPPIDTISHIIELGKSSVLKNGTFWEASFYARYYFGDKNRFFLHGDLFHSNALQEGFRLGDIPCKKGIYPVERQHYLRLNNSIPESSFYVSLDLDQYLNGYNVDTTLANQYVEILYYDSINHIVEGRFQTFLEGPTTWSFLPDSIKMTEGKFHLTIKE